jgi:hypothetical protein
MVVDKINGEVIVIKNLSNFNPRKKPYFQIIEIPKNRYSEVVVDDKIRVRIKFGNAYQLIEYDFQDRDFKILDYNSFAK